MKNTLRQLWADNDLQAIDCCECGIEFAMTAAFIHTRKTDQVSWFCPNGHKQFFPKGETAEQRQIRELKAQAESERQRANRAEESRKWAETNAKGARISAGKALAAKRRLEQRVRCGVCPHCQRTFKQLAAHMKSKHGGAHER